MPYEPPRQRLQKGEPEFDAWAVATTLEIAKGFRARAGTEVFVIAVDGRSAGGKTTFARALASELDAALLSTDDFAWWHSLFDWTDLVIRDGIAPLRAGRPVSVRPQAWVDRGRHGLIEAPARQFVVIEGVGAGQQAMREHVDDLIWIQSDPVEAEHRGLERDRIERPDPEDAQRFWDDWMSAEIPFQEQQRPWEAASLIVCGTPAQVRNLGDGQWLTAPGPIESPEPELA